MGPDEDTTSDAAIADALVRLAQEIKPRNPDKLIMVPVHPDAEPLLLRILALRPGDTLDNE